MKLLVIVFLIFQSHADFQSYSFTLSRIAEDLRNTQGVFRLQPTKQINDSCLQTLSDTRVSWLRVLNSPESAIADHNTARNFARFALVHSPNLGVVYAKTAAPAPQVSGFVIDKNSGVIQSLLLIFNASVNSTSRHLVKKIIEKRLNNNVPFEIGPSVNNMAHEILRQYTQIPFTRAIRTELKYMDWNFEAIQQDTEYQRHLFTQRSLLNVSGFDQSYHRNSDLTGVGALTILFDMNQVSTPFRDLIRHRHFMDSLKKTVEISKSTRHHILLIWDAQHLIEINGGNLSVHGGDN